MTDLRIVPAALVAWVAAWLLTGPGPAGPVRRRGWLRPSSWWPACLW
ncbi:hypothetical protein AB1046_10355 [Promicromonospora sp. Populi]